MFSLQKALAKDDKFFDLLEASAEQARASVQALIRFFKSPDQAKSLDEFRQPRRREKFINAQIMESLATQVITVFESEDVEALSKSLYKIPKTIEKIGERILLAPQYLQGVDLSAQVAMLEKATEALLLMIRELRRGAAVEEIKRHNAELQHIEGEVDKMMVELLRDVYSLETGAGKAVFLRDLYELLERVTDRFRDAGNVVTLIVLKGT
jgi:uncharacterized protein Yka (UPF0111/DUF47 family)